MRLPLAFLTLALASGGLSASEHQDDFRWIQFQGGFTDQEHPNPKNQQPAFGIGVGTWLNGHWGLEISGVATYVNHSTGHSGEVHTNGSMLFNPFSPSQSLRPFLRLGVGTTTMGPTLSGTNTHTTRLNGVLGVGLQVLLGNQMMASLEGRLVQVESQSSRKEAQALAGFGVRWGNKAPVAPPAPPPVVVYVPAPPPPPVVVVPTPTPTPVVIFTPAPTPVVVPRTIVLDEAVLHFANGKAILSPEGRDAVNLVARELKEIKGSYQVVVVGHTSRIGTPAFNLQLSKDRAAAVAQVLEEGGIPAADIRSEGVSFSQPRVKEITKDDQAVNRRVEIEIKTKAENVEIREKLTGVVE